MRPSAPFAHPALRAALALAAGALLALPLLRTSSDALAEPRAAAADAGAHEAGPEEAALAKIATGDPAQIRAGLDDARMLGAQGAPAAPAIAELLRQGLTRDLTLAAIETLGDLGSPAASDALAPYARHRDGELRLAAVRALAKTKGPAAVQALRAALGDPDADVRQNAANGLGALKPREAIDDLFLALDKRMPGVAGAIGEVCDGAQCDRITQKIGDLPFDVISAAAQPMLFRADVSDDTKVRLVDRMRTGAPPGEVSTFLRAVLRGWPATASRRVKQAMEQAVLATQGGAR